MFLFCFFFSACVKSHSSIFICSSFGLDCDSVINKYITTLLLQEDEEGVSDLGAPQEETQPLCHADVLERVLQVIPKLHRASELTDSLCTAILKVCTWGIN